MIPVIETERLRLRGLVLADFERYAEIWAEPEVVRFIGAEPRSRAVSWGSFLRVAGGWALEGFGQWGIERRDTGALVGFVGFFNVMRGIGADFDASPECGWGLAPEAQGQGFGPEAVIAAHEWFDCQPFGGASNVMIQHDHAASIAMARRLGYLDMRMAEYSGDQVLLMHRDGTLQQSA